MDSVTKAGFKNIEEGIELVDTAVDSVTEVAVESIEGVELVERAKTEGPEILVNCFADPTDQTYEVDGVSLEADEERNNISLITTRHFAKGSVVLCDRPALRVIPCNPGVRLGFEVIIGAWTEWCFSNGIHRMAWFKTLYPRRVNLGKTEVKDRIYHQAVVWCVYYGRGGSGERMDWILTYRKLASVSYSVKDSEERWVMPILSFADHCCVATCGFIVEKDRLVVIAREKLVCRSELTLNYSGTICDDVTARQKFFMFSMGYTCKCRYCNENKPVSDKFPDMVLLSRRPFCVHCGKKEDLKKCGRCGVFSYCSGDCQVRNWRLVHRRICKAPE